MHYGLPYQGNKSKIVRDILFFLPNGRRLVDLFGGGGCVSVAAAPLFKWQEILYNDFNPLVVHLLKDAFDGKYLYRNGFWPQWVSREEFHKRKNNDGFIRFCWSFGNNGKSYLYGEYNEEIKRAIFNAVVNKDYSDIERMRGEPFGWLSAYRGVEARRLALLGYCKKNIADPQWHGERMLSRLNLVQRLYYTPSKNKIKMSNISYENYEYEDGDVVYCDVPYEQIKYDKTTCNDYGAIFNNKKFYNWALSRPFPVFFSSYDISDNRFNILWERKTFTKMSSCKKNNTIVIERLYCNMESSHNKQLSFIY